MMNDEDKIGRAEERKKRKNLGVLVPWWQSF